VVDPETGQQIIPLMMKYAALTGMILSSEHGDKQWPAFKQHRRQGSSSARWITKLVQGVEGLRNVPIQFDFPSASAVKDPVTGLYWTGADWICGAQDAPPSYFSSLDRDHTQFRRLHDLALEEEIRRVLANYGFIMHCHRAALHICARSAKSLCKLLRKEWEDDGSTEAEELNGYSIGDRAWRIRMHNRSAESDEEQDMPDMPAWTLPGASARSIKEGNGSYGLAMAAGTGSEYVDCSVWGGGDSHCDFAGTGAASRGRVDASSPNLQTPQARAQGKERADQDSGGATRPQKRVRQETTSDCHSHQPPVKRLDAAFGSDDNRLLLPKAGQ
jgi:hypothetical protein